MLSMIKSKLFAFGAGLIGIMAVIIAGLKYQVEREKRKAAQGRADRSEAAKKANDKATEAMIVGVGDEQRVRKEIEDKPVNRRDLT